MKKVSLLLGIVLAIAAFAGVILLGQLMQPPTYDVAVAIKEVPPFTPLTADLVSIDTQSVSPAIAERYVQAAELDALLEERRGSRGESAARPAAVARSGGLRAPMPRKSRAWPSPSPIPMW